MIICFQLKCYRRYYRYAQQCHFFTLVLLEAILHQLFHRSWKMIQNFCQPKILHRGQVRDFFSTIFLNIFVEKCVSSFRFSIDFMLFKGSVPPSGAFFGSILAAASLHYLGRKYTIIIASPLATIGWILIATATRYEVVIAARFLNGFCVGLCLPSAQVYVSFF